MSHKGMSVTQIIQELIKLDPSYKYIINKLYSQYTRKELLIKLNRKRKEQELCKEKEKNQNTVKNV